MWLSARVTELPQYIKCLRLKKETNKNPVPNKPYGFYGRKASLNQSSFTGKQVQVASPGYGYSSRKSSATHFYQSTRCFSTNLSWCSGDWTLILPELSGNFHSSSVSNGQGIFYARGQKRSIRARHAFRLRPRDRTRYSVRYDCQTRRRSTSPNQDWTRDRSVNSLPRLNNLLCHVSVVGIFAGCGDSICRLKRHVDSLKNLTRLFQLNRQGWVESVEAAEVPKG